MTAPFDKLAVIGLGLIGSSVARAAKEAQLASMIIGIDTNEVSLGFARKQNFVDQISTDAASAITGCDVIVIATPTHLLGDICQAIAPKLAKKALVMDTGSVKREALDAMSTHLPKHALIVPAHPIAGSEQSGVSAGRADLFIKKRVVITPDSPLTANDLKRVDQFWRALGARVEAMPADMHDTIYGYVSHLPQLLAFAVKGVITPSPETLHAYPQLERFMRLCQSNEALWDGIFALNRDVLNTAASRYLDVISHIESELRSPPEEVPSADGDYPPELLFARIVSSCLITTVMEAEKKSGVHFARFAGTGFADFTSPATSDPEHDLEHISKHVGRVLPLLAAFKTTLSERLAE